MTFFWFTMLIVLVFCVAGQAMEVAFTWSTNVLSVLKAKEFWQKGFFAKIRSLLRGTANVAKHNVAMGYCNPLYYPMYGIPAVILCFNGEWFLAQPTWKVLLIFIVQSAISEFTVNFILHFVMGEAPSEASYKKARWNLWGMVKFPYPVYFGMASLGFLRIYEVLFPLLKK